MKSKIIITITVFIYLLLFNSCRKAVRVDPLYAGNWVCPQFNCTFYLRITPGGHGTYYTIATGKGPDSGNPFTGVARIDLIKKHLFIGITKFAIIHLPYVYTNRPDSIKVNGTWQHTLGIKMTLENSIIHGNDNIEFVKMQF